MSWLSGISMTCFAASYSVSLFLEGTRLFFQARIRSLVIFLFAGAGLFAHSCYLIGQVKSEMAVRGAVPLSSWHDFCLVAAWFMAGAYFGLSIRRPANTLGIFLLPLVLGLIGISFLVRDVGAYQPQTALSVWRVVHGISLAVATATVTLGFGTGTMYLVQAYRLKHKILPRPGLKLPSLEWLQRFNREALVISTGLLAAGLLSGVILNLGQSPNGPGSVEWSDPVVLSSGVLFGWLLTVVAFEFLYRPARQGRKVAYLTLASFLFLVLALGFVLVGEHAAQEPAQTEPLSSGRSGANRPSVALQRDSWDAPGGSA